MYGHKNERNTVIKITKINSGIKISVETYVTKKNKNKFVKLHMATPGATVTT